jgi:hypothetical protein
MPTPIPIEDEIKQVFLVAKLDSFEQSEARILALRDSEWNEVLELLEKFEKVRYNFTEIKNGLMGVNISPGDQRLAIRNDIRHVLGVTPPLASESGVAGSHRSSSVPINTIW